ncbi:MAG: DUF692 domain-containing protein, partial [Kiloniellales bacterium]|nr:DUF692 domain-containing protein [Kiloniellales bacterium]
MNTSQTLRHSHPAGDAIPDRVGVGFKAQHAEAILETPPDLGWLEVHPENYMVAGGPRHALLEAVRERYPLSLHGVALSLGGADRPDRDHLKALRGLIDRYRPGLVSEHLAWSARDGVYFADLLPLPLNAETLDRLCRNIDEVQDFLGRRLLIENPANYLALPGSDIPEPEFLTAAARRTGCGLLVDVNNVHVGAHNVGLEAKAYLDALPAELIGEIHIAGHAQDGAGDGLLIDAHGSPVAADVWLLLERLLARCGPRPVLVEWDTDVPDWPTLYGEVETA